MKSPLLASVGLALAGLFSAHVASAAAPAFAPPGRGQAGLAVGSDTAGVLRAKLCSQAPCGVEGGLDLGVPVELRAELSRARLAVVGIGAGRRAIVVTVPGVRGGLSFQVVVAAPLAGAAPKVLFAGHTGLVEGADGVRHGRMVHIFEPDESGARAIVVGTEREDLDLCGRRALLGPELLNPDDLSLRPAKIQRLSPAERAAAPELKAAPVQGGAASAAGVLRALGATSAIGAPQALTDGDLRTSWAENRGGTGRGEFVVMSAPRDLPIAGFELVLTAPGAPIEAANVPNELWLATRGELFRVSLPETARATAGERFHVTLPKPVRTDCLALVQESAFVERPDSKVAVAELSVRSEFASADPAKLVSALAGGGERARAAGAVLRGLGAAGHSEIGARFASLDEGGRRVALDVIDSAPCEVSVPVYVSALEGSVSAQRLHARDRLRRCGRVSANAMAARLEQTQGPIALVYANELSIVAPDRAVEVLTPRVPRAKPAERGTLRSVLARAAAAVSARASVARLLGDAALPSPATLDLLRALGPRVTTYAEAPVALERAARDGSFRTRYLVLGPAALLAKTDARAASLLANALGPQPPEQSWIRWRALELAPREPARLSAFLAAFSDPNVRVREAAAKAVGEGRFSDGTAGLIGLLSDDRWPLARRAAASALGELRPEPRGDGALIEALEDDAAGVRAAAAESLGARRVARAAPELRDRLEEREERFEVKRGAAAALGALCDLESVDLLAKLSRRIDDPLATVEERALGEAALGALVTIAPRDLAERIAPLRKGRAEKAVQRALSRRSPCRRQ